MSTKNLARSAIEGGRTNYYKNLRDDYKRSERRESKAYLKECIRDIETFDEKIQPIEEPLPIFRVVIFSDKLNPVERFVQSKVGKGWNNTYSKIREKFDDRTTAGRHILFDHLLKDISFEWNDHDFIGINSIVVNENGIIKKSKKKSHSRIYRPLNLRNKAINFLGYKKIKIINNIPYWFIDSAKIGAKLYYIYTGGRFIYLTEEQYDIVRNKYDRGYYHGSHKSLNKEPLNISLAREAEILKLTGSYIQDRPLNKEELKFWNKLPKELTIELLKDISPYQSFSLVINMRDI